MPYRVIGARTVAGVAPGGVIDDDVAATLNLGALVASGHVEAVTTRNKPTPTDTTVDNQED